LWHKELGGDTTTVEFPEVNAFAAEIADFVACVRDGKRPVNTEAEGLNVLRMILGAYRSAEEKRIVTLADL
jgi:predicted dehydrogenase